MRRDSPYEIWILPKTHAPAFEDCSEQDIAALGMVLRDVILTIETKPRRPAVQFRDSFNSME